MKIFEYLKKRRIKGCLHMTLIDPDKQDPEHAGKLALRCRDAGTDAVMVGGSFGDAYGEKLNRTVIDIKKMSGLPVILFPNSAHQLSPEADAVFFMSLLNSRSTQYLIDEQMKGSVLVEKYAIEPLSMAYLIVESGTTTGAGWTGDAKPIPRDKAEFAVGYALAAKFFGMKFVYLEAGSGAELPVPNEMIAAVKKAVGDDVFVIVGGGIRDEHTAREKAEAGADIIVTGNIAENDPHRLKEIIMAIKEKPTAHHSHS